MSNIFPGELSESRSYVQLVAALPGHPVCCLRRWSGRALCPHAALLAGWFWMALPLSHPQPHHFHLCQRYTTRLSIKNRKVKTMFGTGLVGEHGPRRRWREVLGWAVPIAIGQLQFKNRSWCQDWGDSLPGHGKGTSTAAWCHLLNSWPSVVVGHNNQMSRPYWLGHIDPGCFTNTVQARIPHIS